MGTVAAQFGARFRHDLAAGRTDRRDLDFEDCLSIEHSVASGCDAIYSYGRRFDRVPGITRLEPQLLAYHNP